MITLKRAKSTEDEGFKKQWFVNVYDQQGNFSAGTQVEAYGWKDANNEAKLWMEKNDIIPLPYSDGIYIDYEVTLK